MAKAGTASLTIAELREFASFSESEQRFIERSLDIGLGRGDAFKSWGSKARGKDAVVRSQYLAYRELKALKRPLPDLVLVDGRMRCACALEAARQGQAGNHPTTICFDDYAPRAHYKHVEKWLGKPSLVGRMAIFQSDRAQQPVAREDVVQAARDWR